MILEDKPELDSHRMILSVRVRTPGGNDVNNQTEKAYRSDPGNTEHKHPDQAKDNSAIIDLSESGN